MGILDSEKSVHDKRKYDKIYFKQMWHFCLKKKTKLLFDFKKGLNITALKCHVV